MLEHHRQQPVEALAGDEVLVHHPFGDEAEPRSGLHRAAPSHDAEVSLAGDHHLAHAGRAGRSAGDHRAPLPGRAHGSERRRAEKGGGDPALVAAGEEDAARRAQSGDVVGARGVLPGVDRQPARAGRVPLLDQLGDVLGARLGALGGGRQHDDRRRRTAREVEELRPEDVRLAAAADQQELSARRLLRRLGKDRARAEQQQREQQADGAHSGLCPPGISVSVETVAPSIASELQATERAPPAK